MSSPTESPRFTDDVDLSKYGLAWKIDDETKKLPDSFFSNISTVTEKLNAISFLKPNGEAIHLKTIEKLGAGSFGKTYSTDLNIEGSAAVVKVIDLSYFKISDYSTLIYDTMQEVLIQILIYESTKNLDYPEIGLRGPFCPRFFCLGKSGNKIFILMESLGRNELLRLFKNKNANSKWTLASAKILKEATLQIAKILGILYNKLSFNHRDFKPDNIMYSMIDGKLNVRIIDFGFSCLTYKKLTLKSITASSYSTKLQNCRSRSRDMHSYFYYLLFYTDYKNIDNCPIKRIFNALCASNLTTPNNWGSTYLRYNTTNANNFKDRPLNLDFDVVYNIFNTLVLLSPDKICSSIEPSWTKHLNIVYENMLPFLEGKEYEFTTEAARTPFLLYYLIRDGRAWGNSTDPNAFITSFSYQIANTKTFEVPEKLIPELFTKHMAYFSQVDKLGETILHKIARNPSVPEIEKKLDLLISTNKLDPIVNVQNLEGKTALDLAIETRFIYAIDKLSDSLKLLDHLRYMPIIVKIYEIIPEKVLSIRSSTKQNIFHFMLRSDSKLREPFLDKLLENNSTHKLLNEVDIKDSYPMDYAISLNQVYFINKIFSSTLYAKVTPQNFLYYLAKITDTELADKLLEKYLDRSYVNYQTSEKITPLMYAAHSNNIYLVRKLIELGAKTALKDINGRTALHVASVLASKHEPGSFEIVKVLIEANPALPNIKNTGKRGPGNPLFATNREVRQYIRSRKSGWFTKRKENTNTKKQQGGTRKTR